MHVAICTCVTRVLINIRMPLSCEGKVVTTQAPGLIMWLVNNCTYSTMVRNYKLILYSIFFSLPSVPNYTWVFSTNVQIWITKFVFKFVITICISKSLHDIVYPGICAQLYLGTKLTSSGVVLNFHSCHLIHCWFTVEDWWTVDCSWQILKR